MSLGRYGSFFHLHYDFCHTFRRIVLSNCKRETAYNECITNEGVSA